MNIAYFCLTVFSFAGCWALWTYGFRPLILDRFRFSIEGLLLELEELVAAGLLRADHPAYQVRRAVLSGLMDIAPAFGFLQLAAARTYAKACADENEPVADVLGMSVAAPGLQHYTEMQLRRMDSSMIRRTMRFVLLRSPVISLVIYTAIALGYGKVKTSEPAEVLRHEAYVSGMDHIKSHVSHDELLAEIV